MIVLRPNSLTQRIDSCLNLILKKQKASGSSTAQVVSFDEMRMMCYLGMSQHYKNSTEKHQQLDEGTNPYANISDYDSKAIASKHFESLEAAMADIYARDFMLKLGYDLRQQVPLLQFKDRLLTERKSLQDSFTLLQPFTDHEEGR